MGLRHDLHLASLNSLHNLLRQVSHTPPPNFTAKTGAQEEEGHAQVHLASEQNWILIPGVSAARVDDPDHGV